MEYEEAKEKIVAGLEKKSKTKSKFYFNDLTKILDMKPRLAKKLINQMVSEHVDVRSQGCRQTGTCRNRGLVPFYIDSRLFGFINYNQCSLMQWNFPE